MVIRIHNLVVCVGLVDHNRDRSCHENVRSMILVVLILNSGEHTILVLIGELKLVLKELFMELFLVNEDLLLVAND